MAQEKQCLPPQLRARVARHRKEVDVGGSEAADLEAGVHGVLRHAGVVLDTPIALLFDGRNELAVADERSGDVTVVGVDAEDVHRLVPTRHAVSAGAASGTRALKRSRNRSSVKSWRKRARPRAPIASAP